MKRRWLLAWGGLWIGLCGCGHDAGSPSIPPDSDQEPALTSPVTAPEEQSWESQLTAVRDGTSSAIRCSGQVTPAQWTELATGCEGLLILSLPEAQIGDSQLETLSHLHSLRHLVLGGPVADDGIAHLVQCPSLEIVNLPRARFTDAGLQQLQQLPLLTLLRFGSPQVTDAGLEHVAAMPNLRFLHLLETPITDAGLDHVKRCPLLESFYIDGGQCTEAGLSCLLRARPGLHLHVNQLHLAGDEQADEH